MYLFYFSHFKKFTIFIHGRTVQVPTLSAQSECPLWVPTWAYGWGWFYGAPIYTVVVELCQVSNHNVLGILYRWFPLTFHRFNYALLRKPMSKDTNPQDTGRRRLGIAPLIGRWHCHRHLRHFIEIIFPRIIPLSLDDCLFNIFATNL